MDKIFEDKYQLLIGGQWVDAEGGKTLQSINPATSQVNHEFADASEADVDKAVKAAQEALVSFKHTSAAERAALLNKMADALEANLQKIATVETMDKGGAIRETMVIDIPYSVDHYRYWAGVIRADAGDASMLDDLTMSLTIKEPIGVVGMIIPWNFPVALTTWKIAPAIAAGDTMVIKPSSFTSASVIEMVKLWQDILPPGVINIVTGSGSGAGTYLANHPGISKLAFTGSTEIGKTIARAAADKLIPATLELGGKSANIFFSDFNWDKGMEGAQLGILFNTGQFCGAGSRILIQEDIYDKMIDALVEKFNSVNVGVPWVPETQVGPLSSKEQMEKVLGYIDLAKQEGATIACGGTQVTDGDLAAGCYIAPTLVTNVDNKMRIAQEEIFGPVAVAIKFKDEEEAIAIANDSEYGLCGAVWTSDINRAIRVARAVETGKMWVNNYGGLLSHSAFGGYKKSGIGRENDKMTLEHYTQTKNIYVSLLESPMGFF